MEGERKRRRSLRKSEASEVQSLWYCHQGNPSSASSGKNPRAEDDRHRDRESAQFAPVKQRTELRTGSLRYFIGERRKSLGISGDETV